MRKECHPLFDKPIINQQNCPERSPSYLCRRFDQLNKGQDYTECMPAVHIGFLDFTPFPESAEASESLYVLNADEMARARSRAREEYILHENALNRKISKLSEENERLRAQLAKYEDFAT